MEKRNIAAPVGLAVIDNNDHPFHGYNLHEVNEPKKYRDFAHKSFLTKHKITRPDIIEFTQPNMCTFSLPSYAKQRKHWGIKLPRQFSYTRAILTTRRHIVQNKYIVKDVRDQGNCGSCYAFAIAEMITDRAAIRTRGQFHDEISPQSLICQTKFDGISGCNGGEPYQALHAVQSNGMAREHDDPYQKHAMACKNTDKRVYVDGIHSITDTKTTNLGTLQDFAEGKRQIPVDILKKNIQHMMEELIHQGPFVAGMAVYSDFTQYKGGVYARHPGSTFVGLHAVEIVGYDQGDPEDSSSIPHWIVRNSWGPSFGNDGFFHIRMGTNEVGIETYSVSATPLFKKGLLSDFSDLGINSDDMPPMDIDDDGNIDIDIDDPYHDTDGGKQRRDRIRKQVLIALGVIVVASSFYYMTRQRKSKLVYDI